MKSENKFEESWFSDISFKISATNWNNQHNEHVRNTAVATENCRGSFPVNSLAIRYKWFNFPKWSTIWRQTKLTILLWPELTEILITLSQTIITRVLPGLMMKKVMQKFMTKHHTHGLECPATLYHKKYSIFFYSYRCCRNWKVDVL